MIWIKLDIKGELPEPRIYHSASLCMFGVSNGMMIVFGGRNKNGKILNDLWGLRKHRNGVIDWIKAKYDYTPIDRIYHTSLLCGNLFIIIGGKSQTLGNNLPFEIFDTEKLKWSNFYSFRRARHSSFLFENYLYIHGGLEENKHINISNELNEINLFELFNNNHHFSKNLLDYFTNINNKNNSKNKEEEKEKEKKNKLLKKNKDSNISYSGPNSKKATIEYEFNMEENNKMKLIEKIMDEGESLFYPNDESIDKKCYEENNIQNWADCFYNLKTGILLEKYLKLMSKTENKGFFEALNYEYGVNNYPLDINKAFTIYKKAADTSNDTLSMYRMYRIYKNEFKKFNLKKRNFVLENFYLLKCYTYLTSEEKIDEELLFQRFSIIEELEFIILNNFKINKKILRLFKFLKINNKIYNINIDDVTLIENTIGYKYISLTYFEGLEELAEKGNLGAIYNLVILTKNKPNNFYQKYYNKLYTMNYYRSFNNYAKFLDDKQKALEILEKSILNGYYNHIRDYFELFFIIYDLEDIFKSPKLKSKFIFIIGAFINDIIADGIKSFYSYILLRRITIKHFNLENEFKTKFDLYTKEIAYYIMKFGEDSNEENVKKIKLYYVNDYYNIGYFYLALGIIYYEGINGIINKDYNKALKIYNYSLENIELYAKFRYETFIYFIKRKLIKKNENSDEKKKDKYKDDLIELEKKLINIYLKDIKKEVFNFILPSSFYILSKLYNYLSVDNRDIILEYVFLNNASNTILKTVKGNCFDEKFLNIHINFFYEKYLKYKAKKKVEEMNKKENFKKIKEGKGAINKEGYGEEGIICPICFNNKKSTICLPCRHFFCRICIDKLTKKNCPICREKIIIIFDIILKEEKLINSVVSSSSVNESDNESENESNNVSENESDNES